MPENMKNLNTRIRLKYDTLENWLKNDPVLLGGEVAIATVSTNENNNTNFQNLPNVVMKVGDGSKKFSELKFFSAMAADVYAWAKSPTRPEYEAKDIIGLEEFIAGEVQDTNTKFKLEQDTNNTHILRLYSQDLGQTDWTLVNEITTADTVYDDTALAGRVTSLEGLVGAEKVSVQIQNAITALDLANTYDAKGAAAQALVDAKAYADGKDAAIKAAKDAADAAQGAVDTLAGKVGTVEEGKTVVGMIGENTTAIGNVQTELTNYKTANDKALADEILRAGEAEAALAAKIGEVAEGENLAGKLAAEVERATNAEGVNAEAAAAAKKAADDITAYVGEFTAEEGVDTVIKYIDKKTSDITSGTEFTELEGRVKAIEDDYLVEADKTELSNAIAAEKERAEGIENGLAGRIKAVEDDYLKNADKEALQGAIDVEKGRVDVLVGDDANKSVRTIANEELAKQLIAEGAQEALDTLGEIAAWIQAHPGDAAAMNKAIEDLTALVGTLPEGATATTVVGYIDEAIAALKIGDYAKASDLLALTDRVKAMEDKVATWDAAEQNAKDYAKGLNDAMDLRMQEVESKKHEHANAEELAKIAAGDVAKWNAAEQNAKDYADGLDEVMNGRMEVVEGKAHEHKNLELLETYTQTEANLADAVAKKHEHANADVLGGITAEKVAAWDAAESNAKSYVDEKIAGLDVADTEVAHQVVTAVSETDGKISVTRKQLTTDDIAEGVETWIFNCGTSEF